MTKRYFNINDEFINNDFENPIKYIGDVTNQIREYDLQIQSIPNFLSDNIQKYIEARDDPFDKGNDIDIKKKKNDELNINELSIDNRKKLSGNAISPNTSINSLNIGGKIGKKNDNASGLIEIISSGKPQKSKANPPKKSMIDLLDDDDDDEVPSNNYLEQISDKKVMMNDKFPCIKVESIFKSKMEIEEDDDMSQGFDDEFGRKLDIDGNGKGKRESKKGETSNTTKKRGRKPNNLMGDDDDEGEEKIKKPITKKAKINIDEKGNSNKQQSQGNNKTKQQKNLLDFF